MLFSSYIFLFVFLPVILLVFALISRRGDWRPGAKFLVLSSLVFYGYWNPVYLILILSSMAFNYYMGQFLMGRSGAVGRRPLALGVAFNLSLLAYFKYSNFAVQNVESILGVPVSFPDVVLPLAISFFTFQQVAYLVDAYRGEIKSDGIWSYALFVSFFPQLIAGPIVHHKWVMPQFDKALSQGFRLQNLYAGLFLFTLAAGDMFTYYGKHKAVLIQYPGINELEQVLSEN